MKSVPVLSPNDTALPLIIKPWHKATVRWSASEKVYICTFEGPGYKKFLFKSDTKYVSSKLERLGFSQYRIKDIRSKTFSHVNIAKNPDGICWKSMYRANGASSTLTRFREALTSSNERVQSEIFN